MLNPIKRLAVLLIVIQGLAATAMADRRDFEETVPMALNGAVVGSFFGFYQYGMSKNMNPKLIAISTAYGLASGALLGAGLDVTEMLSYREIAGGRISESVVLGGVAGAFFGSFCAFIPYALDDVMENRNFYQAFIGAGVGGVIGASLWLTVTMLTEPLVVTPKDNLKMKVGLMPELDWLNVKRGEQPPLFACRCLEINF